MKIKFKKPDPRAGLVVELDETRAGQLIDAGSAEKATAEAPETKAEIAAPDNKSAPAPIRTIPAITKRNR